MKVKIKYEYQSGNKQWPYWAIAGEGLCSKASAVSFEDAKRQLIEDLSAEKPVVPPEEEVEI